MSEAQKRRRGHVVGPQRKKITGKKSIKAKVKKMTKDTKKNKKRIRNDGREVTRSSAFWTVCSG